MITAGHRPASRVAVRLDPGALAYEAERINKHADIAAQAAKLLAIRAEAIAKRDSIPLVDAYTKAYRESPQLGRIENNSRHASIGSSYPVEDPEAVTDPQDVCTLAGNLMKGYGVEAENAVRIAKASLPPMQSLAPTDLGTYYATRRK